jgi:protein-S-isoprenylcysteine O-methyltransferase Ste14
LLNCRLSRCGVASIANAAIVCLPACLINGGYAPPCAALAIFVAAVCEGLALSPQRVVGNGNENGLVMLWNIAHGVAVLICLQAFTVMANTSPLGRQEWEVIGAALLIGGIALRTAAIRTLGEHFADGFEPSAATRVIAGPYHFIRHPAELGLLLIIVGFGTLVRGWSIVPVALFAALTVVSTMRVIIEEMALQGLSGNEPAARAERRFSGERVRGHAARSPFRIADVIKASEPISAYMGNAYQ